MSADDGELLMDAIHGELQLSMRLDAGGATIMHVTDESLTDSEVELSTLEL